MEFAVSSAPLVEETIESTNDLSTLTDQEDDSEVFLNPETLLDAPNAISIDTAHHLGLKGLFMAFEDVTGFPIDSEFVDYAVRHEGQHYRAAAYLGATSARFGIRMHKTQQAGFAVQPYTAIHNLKTTKLGAALITAYPVAPSNGDVLDINQYGYSGIDELAELAMRRNAARKDVTEQFYPVPLGFSMAHDERSFTW